MMRARIAYVAQRGYPLRFFVGLPELLRARGVELGVVASYDDEFQRFCEQEGCEGHPVQIPRSIAPIRDIVSVIQLWRTLRRIRPIIVESQMSKAGLVGMIAAWAARVPIRIYTNHGVAFSSATGWKRAVLRFVETVSCRLASHVRAISPSVRELMVREGCCKSEKIGIRGKGSTGIDAEGRFNPMRIAADLRHRVRMACNIPSDALVLGFVGRIAALKGVDDLAEAWGILREEYPTLHLLIVGSIDSRSRILPQTAALLRSDPRIHCTDEVRDTAPYFNAMDVLTLPSTHEGLPISLLEGAAMRLPVVASRIPGNTDAVRDGETGTLFSVHDVKALVEAVGKYLDDPMLRQTHGIAGREHVLYNFQREIVWGAWCEEYLHLLQEIGCPLPEAARDSQAAFDIPSRRAA